MGIAKKSKKHLKESETLQLEDRISNLPENLIVHILSLLPTKHAVGTSALSKFWKKQWTFVPNLDFDDTVLKKASKLSIYRQPGFVGFVNRVMKLHKPPQLFEFRLKCHQWGIASDLNYWISTVLARNVRKLELDLSSTGLDYSVPCEIFTCSSLVELRLGSWFLLNIPTLVCLPNLREVYLCNIKFADKESSKRLFSSCPVLEDLTIIYVRWCDEIILNISSPTVKRLVVDSSHSQFPIKLNTPLLEHLNYVGPLAEGSLSENMEFLTKVYFHMPCFPYLAIKEAIKVLAHGISNVESLYLSGEVLEALEECRLDFQPFANLRTLVIGYNRNGAWKMLPQLLEKGPNLKYLELNDGLYGKENHEEYFEWVPPKVVPACLLLHLEGITVHAFKGDAEELKMINYFLINSKVLKKLVVKSAMDAEKERIINKKLLTFRKEIDEFIFSFSLYLINEHGGNFTVGNNQRDDILCGIEVEIEDVIEKSTTIRRSFDELVSRRTIN